MQADMPQTSSVFLKSMPITSVQLIFIMFFILEELTLQNISVRWSFRRSAAPKNCPENAEKTKCVTNRCVTNGRTQLRIVAWTRDRKFVLIRFEGENESWTVPRLNQLFSSARQNPQFIAHHGYRSLINYIINHLYFRQQPHYISNNNEPASPCVHHAKAKSATEAALLNRSYF